MKIQLIALVLISSISTCSLQKAPIQVIENDQGVLFTENGKNVLFYQRVPKSFNGRYTRNNYVHPLWSLDGDTLTEDFPPDHLHHRGIFWTWHQVFVGETRLGDAWECRDFVWDVIGTKVTQNPSSASLAVKVLWKSPDFIDEAGDMIPTVEENTIITVYSRKSSHRDIDFKIQLLALQPGVTLGGSEDTKGYGGFSVRIKCPQDMTFTSSTGQVEPQDLAVKAGPWMDMIGSFNPDKKSGIAIYCHPQNPGDITQWILRHVRKERSMQNPVYPGRERVPLSSRQPTVLKYRLVLHGPDIQRWYDSYAKQE